MVKIKENIKEQPKYPSLILGLDISTSCIGISLIQDDGINQPEIIKITHVVPKIPNKIKGIEALILRKKIFEKDFLNNAKDLGITECIIESPLKFATGNSTPQTVAQLLQFNGLISEAIYDTLNIVPSYVSSYEARMMSFPELLSIRKFNKKGIEYPRTHIKKAIQDNHLVLFGNFPFDCDKKRIMMNLVSELYPSINWLYDKNGELRKENFDACDALVCALAYSNKKRYGELNAKITTSMFIDDVVEYQIQVWNKLYNKKIQFKEN